MENKAPKEKDEAKPKKEKAKQPPRLSPLDPQQLMKDSQVRRAMDILTGYAIFKTMHNG
jgi:hypothetical protein